MISVAMATCQGEPWIAAQLGSILEQLGPRDEIVVADASSSDRTLQLAQDIGGNRLRVIENLPRGSVPATFEAALRACRGERIFLSDQDDIWLSGKVEKCLRSLEGRPSLVLHDAMVTGPEHQILSPSFLASRRFRPGFWPNLWRPGYLGCALAFRRELLERALPFPGSLAMHDWWLGLLAERTGGIAVLREPLIEHRRHGGNANFEPNRSPYPLTTRLGFRWRMWREVQQRLGRTP